MGKIEEYKEGSMDISEHEKTFTGFVHFARNFIIITIVFLILLAMFGH